ncbi:Acetyltransferase (GNAT) family protein [Alkalibacterium subtropicum]|uniref:Acetyltransferase (GNAT) family protein n=1 Tax=Alkalibacterium subtropicum TaxID=753702 RepID=A0A1I1H1L9_9LACT|nr:GNAT family N-acetyltransferase [Alkalibacterium subtropicum]SFC15313.1 Acetyltransferase (GNAT) family protein [Alkalibacterium subtropicum]
MSKEIRRLTQDDLAYYQNMQTGLDDDYMLWAFHRIISGPNHLFGLFVSDELVALSGFTVFKDHYAMLGRLRTDERYRKNGYGTEIVRYSLEQALLHPDVKWIGANTEQHNKASQAVLKKVGLPPVTLLYAAQTDSVSSLIKDDSTHWAEITDISEKADWIRRTYLDPSFDKKVFPLEAYYPFPVSEELFEGSLDDWHFYENADKSRCVILWEEFKGMNYLHVVYPWHDFMEQPGLFRTIQKNLKAAQQKDRDTVIWWDLSEREAALLPTDHPFDLPSPWILHGLSKEALLSDDVSESFERANTLIQDVEKELQDLEQIIEKETETLDALENQLHDHTNKE